MRKGMAMGKLRRLGWSVLFVIALLTVSFGNITAQPASSAGQSVVYVISIEGNIDEGLASYVERTVQSALADGADALLLEINTFGGRVDSATEIRDLLLGADTPVLAFVSERAWSAGALIALAADR